MYYNPQYSKPNSGMHDKLCAGAGADDNDAVSYVYDLKLTTTY